MITRDAPRMSAAEAARRASGDPLPAWLVSPGAGDLRCDREFVACDPVKVVRGSSIDALDEVWREQRAAWDAGPGVPIAIGFFSYDLGRRLDRVRGFPRPATAWPDAEFRFYDAVWTREAASGVTQVWARDTPAAQRLLDRIGKAEGRRSAWGDSGPGSAPHVGLGPLTPVDPPAQHLVGVARVLEYIRAGDVYQVNLARRLIASVIDPEGPIGWALFARLQMQAPAPHGLWLADPAEGWCLVGNSPERFLRMDGRGNIETRPIKGTRPRDGGAGDAAAVAELVGSAKDRAELAMIVDLERNDLGRVCVPGSIEVVNWGRVVTLPTVHHLVSTIGGQLRSGARLPDVLKATFPGGSVTGAPKLRAMEIIDELEPERRGPYTGATGWLGAAGDLDLAVAIRTALIRDRRLTLWVGGGVVADSIPEEELRETEAKAVAFSRLCR